MDFRNEIAPIGALSYIGIAAAEERRRQLSARRRGGRHLSRDTAADSWARMLAASTNRIREFTDSTGDTPVTHRDVEPLLTPRLLSARARVSSRRHARRHDRRRNAVSRVGRSCRTTATRDSCLPAAFNVDGSVSWRVGAYEIIAARQQPHRQQDVRQRLRERRRLVLLRGPAAQLFRHGESDVLGLAIHRPTREATLRQPQRYAFCPLTRLNL